MPDKQTLPELFTELETELIRLGYTKGSLDFYRRRWKQLLCYANVSR